MWACGVAAAARAAATAPGLRLFVLGVLGGVAGVWEAREPGVWRRFSAELEGEHMRTSGLLGAGGGGAAGAGAGAAGWAELGSGSAVGEGGGGEDESGGGLGSATEGRLIYIGWDISLSLSIHGAPHGPHATDFD